MKKKVLVGLSGGVDSAVSAYLLKEQGYDVTAGFMINYLAPEGEYCPTKDDLEEAKKVAKFLEIPFFTFDYREDYTAKVLDYMYEGYQKGITPNPDIMCNSEVKFKVFLDEALELGFDYIAMGHYAQIVKLPHPNPLLHSKIFIMLKKFNFRNFFIKKYFSKNFVLQEREENVGNEYFHSSKNLGQSKKVGNTGLRSLQESNMNFKDSEINSEGQEIFKDFEINSEGHKYFLKKGADENKDQSYFLAGLNQFQLSKAIFPIGHLQKSEVREIAEKIGLPNAKRKDSQGICFVGKVDLTKFLEKKISPKPGLVKDTSGKILGEHKGVFYYTIGQRKGLDIGGQKEPIFVVRKDIEKNEIIVGTSADLELYSDYLELKNISFLTEKLVLPFSGKAKIRYRQKDQKCILDKNEAGKYFVKFEEKQRAITSGQIFALYDENDFLVASGVID